MSSAEPPPRLTIQLPVVPRAPATRSPPVASAAAAALASVVGTALWSGSAAQALTAALGVVCAILALWGIDGLVGSPSRARRERRRFDDDMRATATTLHDLHRRERAELRSRFPGSAAVARAARARTDATSGALTTRASSAGPQLVLGRGEVASAVVPLPIRAPEAGEGRDGRGGVDVEAEAARARLSAAASVLDDGPLCVEARGLVGVVGPVPLARAAASGYLLQARRSRADRLEVMYAADLDAVSGADVIIEIALDASAEVTRRAGRPCRVPVDLDYVSVLDVVDRRPA